VNVGVIVNGRPISDQQIEQEMNRLRPQYDQAFADMDAEARELQLRDWATENLIERTVVEQEGTKSGIQVSAEEVEQVLAELKKSYEDPQKMFEDLGCQDEDQVRQRIAADERARRLVAQAGKTADKPTSQQIEQYYQEHREQFVQSEQVRSAHIVKYINVGCSEQEAEAVMQQAYASLERGIPFELVASQFSDDRTPGGSLGLVGRGELVGELEDILFNLGPGQTSGVFRTRYGFHIAKVHDRIPPKPLTLSQVRGHIEAVLSRELASEAAYAFIDSLRAKARIEKT
jgi:parvulin-like peptidyl-prolyl isomerase